MSGRSWCLQPARWDIAQNVNVWAIHDNIVDGSDAKVVPAEDSRVNAIRGPLTIDGADPTDVNTDLNHPFMLPGEKNDPLPDGAISDAGTVNGNAYLTDVLAKHVDPKNALVELAARV